MSRLNPQVRGLANGNAGSVVHNRQKKRIDGLFLFVECGLVSGTAGERAIAHVAPEILPLRPVGGLSRVPLPAMPDQRGEA